MIVAAITLVLVVAVVLVVRAVSLATAQSEYDAAAAAFQSDQAAAVRTVTDGETALDDAIATLAASEGKVFTEQPRLELADAIDTATTRLSAAAQKLTTAESTAASSAASTTLFEMGVGVRDDARTLSAFDFGAANGVDGVAEDLAVPMAAVNAAMAEWQAEQERILRERYTNNVHATGWTPELDQCIGSVDVTAHYQDVPTIAEHWSCGGKDFPDDAGTVITLTGVHAGTYRVDGIVVMLNADRDSTADIPRGYDLLYQTCQNGQSSTMSFTALTKIV
ncbi:MULTISPECIES: hypothetical protein [unclassified Cryobacterium]|uniref:hypothetical protein n=1 Tax=unclassified Cryobacterium TaxID=2649013 RepID=UPI00106A2AAA|nr:MULTISPECIES: hypothetical protein [unclassified Cryobacterium]TFC53563.1 hypothetical protein E3O68_12615 [Cryobacterium sp. TMB3-1-2]TFC69228.1 hypothetical protein E3T21_13595 [Cryobacterium sp. TMB3-15]TFC75974.1 hypothetical protein E3T22_08220 [Cryobacterium sp. TMB3-10]TFC86768.1 hypothetical protein E3T19_14320 [Cryobacterium sp. TMT4-31]TFD40480.1 hypothetical protein E3T58_13205 [Cryobacterium sp. TMB3-12]